MTRISKDEHPRILHMVDVEHLRVSEVAVRYGCTPANIYALLAKLRRAPAPAVQDGPAAPDGPAPESAPVAPVATAAPADLFGAGVSGHAARRADPAPPTTTDAVAPSTDSGTPPRAPETAEPARRTGEAAEAARPAPTNVTDLPRGKRRDSGVGAKLAKPGFGLVMRTGEGEDNLTPFRSLDDLLSAVKPILRAASRSPDTVWFSIQPVDLASLDIDAA